MVIPTKNGSFNPLYPPILSHAVAKLCVCEAWDLGESGGSWGAPPNPRQRGFAPYGIPFFVLCGAGGKPAWRILSPLPWPVLSEVEVLRTSSAKNLSLREQETLRYAQGDNNMCNLCFCKRALDSRFCLCYSRRKGAFIP